MMMGDDKLLSLAHRGALTQTIFEQCAIAFGIELISDSIAKTDLRITPKSAHKLFSENSQRINNFVTQSCNSLQLKDQQAIKW